MIELMSRITSRLVKPGASDAWIRRARVERLHQALADGAGGAEDGYGGSTLAVGHRDSFDCSMATARLQKVSHG